MWEMTTWYSMDCWVSAPPPPLCISCSWPHQSMSPTRMAGYSVIISLMAKQILYRSVVCFYTNFFFFTYLRESLVWIIPDIRYVVTIIRFSSPDQIPMLINCKELNNFKNQLFIATVIKWITDVRVVCSVTFYILINCI